MKYWLGMLVLYYLRFWARIRLSRHQQTIIGITGSSGKTSALYACEAVLREHTKLKVSHKANSESGIPLDILGLHINSYTPLTWIQLCLQAPFRALFGQDTHQTYLVEMGIDSPLPPKNMEYLLTIIKPTIGIYLGASAVHAENYDHLIPPTTSDRLKAVIALIAAEKGKLLTTLPESGTAIINADDQNAAQLIGQTRAKIITFGSKPDHDICIKQTSWTTNSTIFALQVRGTRYQVQLTGCIVPEVFGYTLAAAMACAMSQSIALKKIITSLETNLTLPPGRSSILAGVNGCRIIDSSYNASKQPMLGMLELLSKVPGKRKVALLGDMREMGEATAEAHQSVARRAAKLCDEVHLVGPLMREHALGILQKAGVSAHHHVSAREAARLLKTQLQKDDVLLVKGSQNTLLLEIAVAELLDNPADTTKLCRRGAYWDAQRARLS